MAVIIIDICMVVAFIIHRIKTFKMQHSCKCIRRDIKSSLLKIINADLCFFDEQFGETKEKFILFILTSSWYSLGKQIFQSVSCHTVSMVSS